jgi:cyclase
MKKLLVFVIFIAPLSVCCQSYHYDVEKVVESVYVLKPVINDYRWVTANIILIVNERDALVVDSGLNPRAGADAILEIKKITQLPIKYLVNTHWHGDHWQGNESFVDAYPGIEIIASAEGRDGIMRNGMVWVRQYYFKYLQRMVDSYEEGVKKGFMEEGKPLTAAQMKTLKDGLTDVKADIEAIKKMKPTFPTVTFDKLMTIRRGGRDIEVHHLGWGNTTGDAVIYLPKEKILITGDMVVSPSPYESGAFSREWLESSKKLRTFQFDHLIPGHGEVQHDATYLDFLNALFAETIKQIDQAWLSGKSTLDEANKVVTHETVVAELSKDPKNAKYLKDLSPDFVPSAVRTAWQKTKEGKL